MTDAFGSMVTTPANGRYAHGLVGRPPYPTTPFQEKHMVESLDVRSVDVSRPVIFYNMLNQGPKRGK